MGLTFTLNIPSKTDNPIHQLSEVMTVGSQVGDLILRDPSVEAKHCTFLVNDDVVSIIDHESSVGTFVHGERIPSSRMIILNNGDRLKIGEVDVELIAQDSGDGTANILLYSLGAVSQNDGKSVEQLIVDQIINEVAIIE